MISSFRDALLVARFELLRNLRTWRAMALCLMYLIATTGSAWLFTRFLRQMENGLAQTLGVPATKKPGALVEQMLADSELRTMVQEMVGTSDTFEVWIQEPLLIILHFAVGLLLIPFLAATTSAESVSLDLKSRAVRFECLRTGRLEFVVGRFFGLVLLMGAASLLSISGTWVIGMMFMVGNEPVELFVGLLKVTPLVWVASFPFVGIGVACSQLTTSPNLARVLALSGVVSTWILLGISKLFVGEEGLAMLWDIPIQLMPQTWIDELWLTFPGYLPAMAVLIALGGAATAVTMPFFLARDL